MSVATLLQFLTAFGPIALNSIPAIINLWNTPALTVEQACTIIAPLVGKTPDQYLAEAKAALGK